MWSIRLKFKSVKILNVINFSLTYISQRVFRLENMESSFEAIREKEIFEVFSQPSHVGLVFVPVARLREVLANGVIESLDGGVRRVESVDVDGRGGDDEVGEVQVRLLADVDLIESVEIASVNLGRIDIGRVVEDDLVI